MALVEVKVPDIGDFDEVAVIELLVKEGDTVKAEQSLITVESDKASMEIPSSTAGVVKALKVKLGDKVSEGSVVLLLEAQGAAAAAPASPAAPAAPVAPVIAAAPASVAAASSATGPVEVRVPDIGDFKDVAVIEVFVKPGDTIKLEQSLITVESDKASMEVPSSAAGVLKELKVKLGDKVNIGDLLAVLEGSVAGAAAVSAAPAPVAASPAATAPAPVAAAPVVAAATAVAVAAHAPEREPGVPAHGCGKPDIQPAAHRRFRQLGQSAGRADCPVRPDARGGFAGMVSRPDVDRAGSDHPHTHRGHSPGIFGGEAGHWVSAVRV